MKKIIKNINSEDIFKFAIFLLPFENFFFAPSKGWATITPIILFIYMFCNYNYLLEYIKKYKKYFIIGISILILNIIISSVIYFNLSKLISSMIPIVLGITALLSFCIYYQKEKDIKSLSKLIYYSYLISFVVGLIQFASIKFDLDFMYSFFDFLFKRNYFKYNRVQFFFTEPSFIGMHLFGVLLPYYLFTKNKKIRNLIILFSVASIAFTSSVRILLDVFVVLFIFIVGYLIRKKKIKLLVIIPILCLMAVGFMYNNNYRVRQIVDKGIYADGSLASRYFRVQSSIYGYAKNPLQTLVGYGIGNSIIPLRKGYSDAKEKYKSSYMKEVNDLGNPNYFDDSASYCLYTRFISEFGMILFVIVLKWIFDITKKSKMQYKYEYLLVTLYLYLQFESYAFYALWIYILAMLYSQHKKVLE